MTIEIDHMAFSVGDYDRAKAFYTAALKPLRGGVLMEFPMDDGGEVMGLRFRREGIPVDQRRRQGHAPAHRTARRNTRAGRRVLRCGRRRNGRSTGLRALPARTTTRRSCSTLKATTSRW